MRDLSFTALVMPWIHPTAKLTDLEYAAWINQGKIFILEQKILLVKRTNEQGK